MGALLTIFIKILKANWQANNQSKVKFFFMNLENGFINFEKFQIKIDKSYKIRGMI